MQKFCSPAVIDLNLSENVQVEGVVFSRSRHSADFTARHDAGPETLKFSTTVAETVDRIAVFDDPDPLQEADAFLRQPDPGQLMWRPTGRLKNSRHWFIRTVVLREEKKLSYSLVKGWYLKVRWVVMPSVK